MADSTSLRRAPGSPTAPVASSRRSPRRLPATLVALLLAVLALLVGPLSLPASAEGTASTFAATADLRSDGGLVVRETITFAGNAPGITQTLPIAAYIALNTDYTAAIAISVLLVIVSLAVLVSLRERWLRGIRS